MRNVSVRYDPVVPTRSNKVKSYVRAVRMVQALAEALEAAHATRVVAQSRLTGTQLGEARLILRETE